MLRTLAILMLVMVVAGTSFAQTPVAVGQSIVTGELRGTVKTSDGAILADVPVTLQLTNGEMTSTVTQSNGEFTARVRPGFYKVSASKEGFAATPSAVKVEANATATVSLVLRGPVPNGEPVPSIVKPPPDPGRADVPISASGEVAVEEQFNSSTELASWLNAQSARGLRLQTIAASTANKSFFVWVAHPAGDQLFAIEVGQPSSATDLQKILNAYSQQHFIGLIQRKHGAYLVFRSNP